MAEDEGLPPPLKTYFTPNAYTSPSCIRIPTTVAHYEIKPGIVSMLTPFFGLPSEDPYKHINQFLKVCSTVKLNNLTEETLRLILFPFSLRDRAEYWLNSLKADSVTSWQQLVQEFLKKYFPKSKTNQIRRSLTSFSQRDGEQFHEAWDRLNELMRSCPHHDVPQWQLVESFYEGLTEDQRNMVDASCEGAFLQKSAEEGWALFETLNENSIQRASTARNGPSTQATVKASGIFEVRQSPDLSQKVEKLTQTLENIFCMGSSSTTCPTIGEECALCLSLAHPMTDCHLAPHYPKFVQEHVNAT